jgi:hypothetical protein
MILSAACGLAYAVPASRSVYRRAAEKVGQFVWSGPDAGLPADPEDDELDFLLAT